MGRTLPAEMMGGGSNIDDLPIGSVIQYDGEDIPEGWSEVEDKPFIQCGLTSNVSLSTTRVYLNFDNNTQRGDMFTIDYFVFR